MGQRALRGVSHLTEISESRFRESRISPERYNVEWLNGSEKGREGHDMERERRVQRASERERGGRGRGRNYVCIIG